MRDCLTREGRGESRGTLLLESEAGGISNTTKDEPLL
jgi:hypothetical protein